MGPGRGRGCGPGRGMGYGRGRGFGPGLGARSGWLAAGYGAGGALAAAANMKAALEERKSYLRAELARTEALLGEATAGGGVPPCADAGK